MDDPNITMEEYIRLEEEKARRHGRTFNWQTATFGKVKNYKDEDDHPIDFETEFPAIVFGNTLTTIQSEPTSSEDNEITHGENGFSETSHDKIIKTFETGSFVINLNIVIWNYYVNGMLFFLIINLYVSYDIPFDPKRYYKDGSHTSIAEAKIWHHYQLLIRGTHDLDIKLRSILRRLGVVTSRGSRLYGADRLTGRRMTWRQFILALGLHTEQEMAEAGFGAYWAGSDRLIPDKGDLRDYWMEISSDRDFLGPTPSYVLIRDHVRRLCHKMIAYSISGMGQAPEKVTGVDLFYLRSMDRRTANVPHLLAHLFRRAEGRKSRARLSGGHFIGRLAMRFRLVSDEGLRGPQVVTRELPLIDLHELGRLHICTRYGDTWAWIAQGLERQQAATADAPKADEAGQAAEEVALEIPAPAQHKHLHHLHPPHSHVLCHKGSIGSRRRCTTYGVMLWACEEMS
ncbi:hypothetical protein Tco_0623937 [Tanacetum coccineum]|uniref:Uncharacterized protein n=1 Tax=Tanacetum coccineum TaxID=301880 RepID=A0ABQ4WCM1_9ASTR